MKLTQHGPHLWKITRYFGFNCYLVQETSGLTLIDTNMAGSANVILEAARTIGQPITRIALTHAHGDHAGSLDELAARLPDAEVVLAPRTSAFLRGELTLLPGEPQTPLRGGFIKAATQAARPLIPGEMLGSLRVMAAPGHTPDHMAFLDERDGTLIAGDALQTAAGTAVAGITRWLFPFPAMATWHLPTALATAVTLHALNPSRLAVGHGRVLENPAAEMAAAIHIAEKKAHGQTQMA